MVKPDPYPAVAKLLRYALIVSILTVLGCMQKDMTVVTGTIAQTDTGLIIQTAKGEYTAMGVDIIDLVGRKVEVTGKVATGHSGKIFNVIDVRELK